MPSASTSATCPRDDDCRALYERYYSKEAFARTLTTAVKELTEKVEQLNNK